jgi:20S proteasome alpha/beta subunit
MTTCIAAITQRFYIATASDTRLSFGGSYSTDGVLKDEGIHREWGALVAGDDISHAPFVIEEAKRLLRNQSGELNIVKDAFRKAYQSCRSDAITDNLLSSFEMTIDEFKKKGSKQLHPEVFADISIRMRSFTLGCTFMVYGFDDTVQPHILTIRNPGRVESFDKPGFWAIGAGASSALSTLSVLKQHPDRCSVEQTIYNVLAAKYSSESASDVGPETWVWIKRVNCNGFSSSAGWETEVKTLWQTEGRPKTLPSGVQAIQRGDLKFYYEGKDGKPRLVSIGEIPEFEAPYPLLKKEQKPQ